jgi:hypothetical protein
MARVVMLVDTRDPQPGPRDDGSESWLVAVLDVLLPWPVLIAWLIAGALLMEDWIGVGCAWGAVVVSFWRLTKIFPTVGGMRDHIP